MIALSPSAEIDSPVSVLAGLNFHFLAACIALLEKKLFLPEVWSNHLTMGLATLPSSVTVNSRRTAPSTDPYNASLGFTGGTC